MLKDNIRKYRKVKGISQEELALEINVVRQTISKWEKGLSVPDSDMLISISRVLEIPVSVLLGQSMEVEHDVGDICEKLEMINLQLAKNKVKRRKMIKYTLMSVIAFIIISFVVLYLIGSPYQITESTSFEMSVVKVIFHGMEWVYVRVAPIIFIVAIALIVYMNKKYKNI